MLVRTFGVFWSDVEHQLGFCLSQVARGKDNADGSSKWRNAEAPKQTNQLGEKRLKKPDGCEGEGWFFGVVCGDPLSFHIFTGNSK